jgi:archaellum component FlaC
MNQEIIDKITNLENKINNLEQKIDLLIKTCGRMDSHINFVETTYETLRSPLNFIKNKLNYTRQQLPELPDAPNHQ